MSLGEVYANLSLLCRLLSPCLPGEGRRGDSEDSKELLVGGIIGVESMRGFNRAENPREGGDEVIG